MHIPKLLTAIAAIVALVLIGLIGYQMLRPSGPLLSNAAFEKPQISPNADGQDDVTLVRYSLSSPARVSIYLIPESGEPFYFRTDEPRNSGDYSVPFSGVVNGYTLPDETVPGRIERRLIPNGRYTWVIEAIEDGATSGEQATGVLEIVDGDSALPIMSAFEVFPEIFTPNQDGIDDRVSVNVFLEKPASLDVYLESEDGQRYYIPEREGGREPGDSGNHEYDYDGGVDQNLEPPPDGSYKLYAVAQDAEGQRIVREDQLSIRDGGLPQVEIIPQVTGAVVFFDALPYDETYFRASIDSPESGQDLPKPEGVASDLATVTIVQGDLLVFKLTVNNYGSTPIRTAGPFPGAVYQFDQIAASFGAYEESGAWRIGIKCDTSLSDFPWRWALAPKDELTAVDDERNGKTYYYLQPGQRAEVWGAIRMTELITARNPQDCWAGLIHEDVGIPEGQSRVGAREIEIVAPPDLPPADD